MNRAAGLTALEQAQHLFRMLFGFLDRGQCLITSPLGPMTTVERIVPCTSLPYIIFLPKR